jgi:hypothetical protein
MVHFLTDKFAGLRARGFSGLPVCPCSLERFFFRHGDLLFQVPDAQSKLVQNLCQAQKVKKRTLLGGQEGSASQGTAVGCGG